MLIVNLIDKAHLSSEGYADGSSTTAWRARLVLFCGFALLAGGLAGSIVRPSPSLVRCYAGLSWTSLRIGGYAGRAGLDVKVVQRGAERDVTPVMFVVDEQAGQTPSNLSSFRHAAADLSHALTSLTAPLLTCQQTTLVVKYLLAARPPSDEGIAWGVQNVIWNAGIMASAVVLWVAQLGGDEYE